MKSFFTAILAAFFCVVDIAAQKMPTITEEERKAFLKYDVDSMFNMSRDYFGSNAYIIFNNDTLKKIAAAQDSAYMMAGVYAHRLSHYRLLEDGEAMKLSVDSMMMYPIEGPWEEFIYWSWQHYPNFLSDKRRYSEALSALAVMQHYANLHDSRQGEVMHHFCSGYLYLSMFQSELAVEHFTKALELIKVLPKTEFTATHIERCQSLLLRAYDSAGEIEKVDSLGFAMLETCTSAYGRMCVYVALFCNELSPNAQVHRQEYADSIEWLVKQQAWTSIVKRPYNRFRSIKAMYEHQMDTALFYTRQAIDTLNCFVRSAMIYAHEGMYKEAYHYECEAYHELNLRSRADLTASLASSVERLENERLQHEMEISEAKSSMQQLFYLLGVLVIIICIVVYETLRFLRHSRELEREKQATQDALKEAEKASKMKTVFLQNVSHEVRTPLNAISGFSDILTAGIELDSEMQAEYAKLVRHNVDLLTLLFTDTITISNLDSQAIEPHLHEIDLCALCRSILDERPAGNYRQKGVEMIFDIPAEPIKKDTDPMLLADILFSLLSNAFKYTEEGSVTLALKPIDDGKVQISVTDTGCGIAPENAERVFERFEKLGSFVQGNGLGLSIAREKARLIGGKVWLDTTHKGPGARFVLEL